MDCHTNIKLSYVHVLKVDKHMRIVNHKLKDPKGMSNVIKFVLLLDFSIIKDDHKAFIVNSQNQYIATEHNVKFCIHIETLVDVLSS